MKKIKYIEDSFEACKIPPVHAINKKLHPVECLPLLPDFDRYKFTILINCDHIAKYNYLNDIVLN